MRAGISKSGLPRSASDRPLLLCLLIANPSLALGQAAPPPENPQPTEQPQEQAIIITGSRIPRQNLTAVSPVTVIQRDEVKLEGVTLSEDLLNQLPMVSPDQGAFTSNGATGTATVDLRGLGAARTLVLLNGRRLMPGDPSYPAPDINAVPSVLIKRVEVLTGGASSVYGSDAVAGVVNFILDTQLKGVRIDGQASFFQHRNRIGEPYTTSLEARGFRYPKGNVVNGGRQDINAAAGTSFLDGRGHVTAYAGYRELSKVTQDSRDFSACSLGVNFNDPTILQCGGSPASFPANLFTNFGPWTIGPDRTFRRGLTFFNFAPWNYFQRPDKRYIGGGFADLEINVSMKPYLEVMYMRDRSAAQFAPSANFGNTEDINCDNPLLSAQQRARICFTGNFVGEVPVFDNAGNLVRIDGSPTPFVDPVTGATYFRGTLFVLRRNVEGGARHDDLRHKNLRLLGGIKGELARGLTYDASYLHGQVKFSALFTNELSITKLHRALDVIADPSSGAPVCRSVLTGEDPACLPWDIFALEGVTPEAAAYLGVTPTRKGEVREQVATAFITSQLGEWGIRLPWADEGPAANIGAEYRKDLIDFRPDEIYQAGDLAGSDPQTPYSGSLRVNELFGEIRIPVVERRFIERLTIEGGYRQSWYSNPENRFTTNSYKIAADLTPLRGIRFRGSHQRAVRAPNIVELFAPPGRYEFERDPCAGVTPVGTIEQCQRTGVTPGQYGNIVAVPADAFGGYNARFGGNALLEPEKATTRTLGVVLEPRFLPGFNATIDWFDIQLKGAVAEIGAQIIVDTCLQTGDPLFCSRIHRDPNGSLWLGPDGFVDDRFANIGALNVRGIDFGAQYTTGLGRLGSATANFLGSRLEKHVTDNGGLSTALECGSRYGFPCIKPLPRWRHKARLTWEARNGLSLSLNWRRIGKVRLASLDYRPELPTSPRDAHLPAMNYFDVTGLFNVRSKHALRLGVSNIFDRAPPIIAAANTPACGFVGCNGNTYPQLYDPLGRYVFAGFTVGF